MKKYIDFSGFNIEFLSGAVILAVTSLFAIFEAAFQMRDIFLRILIIGGPFIAILPLTYVMVKKFTDDHPFKLLLIAMFYIDFLMASAINLIKGLHFMTTNNYPKDFMVIIMAFIFGMLLNLFGLAKILEEPSDEDERRG